MSGPPILVTKENFMQIQSDFNLILEPAFTELRKYKLENIILHKDIKALKDENFRL